MLISGSIFILNFCIIQVVVNYRYYNVNNEKTPWHYQLYKHIMQSYNSMLLPVRDSNKAVVNHLRIDLYQIIEVNEIQQYVTINVWNAERWNDDILSWDKAHFNNITRILLPHQQVWCPDTTLYNSLEMDDSQSRRLTDVKVISGIKTKAANIELLYPAIYKFSCSLNLRFFPYDIQNCELIFGSWTHDNKVVDYTASLPIMSSKHFVENEEWEILNSRVSKKEVKYECCPNNYTLLIFTLNIRRRPLFYLVNLIAPTSFITLIAIFGFFSTPSINDIRDEKISLGITTLLSMSILMLMISDKMPSTSSFIPLIGWFYFGLILLIALATMTTAAINSIQKKGTLGKRPSEDIMKWVRWLGALSLMEMPFVMKLAYQEKIKKNKSNAETRAPVPSKSRKKDKVLHSTKRWKTSTSNLQPSRPPIISEPTSTDAAKDGKGTTIHLSIPTQSTQTQVYDMDDLSLSLQRNPTRIRTVGMMRSSRIVHRFNEIANPLNSSANLAQLEFDWVAAVIERCCLIVFFITFASMCLGINGVGIYNWWQAKIEI